MIKKPDFLHVDADSWKLKIKKHWGGLCQKWVWPLCAHFAAFSNILLETFVPNLVFLACPSLQVLSKTQIVKFLICEFLVNPLQKEILITPEPVTILTGNFDH